MKKFLIGSAFFLFVLSATVYCVQYVDFNPFADINMQMRFRVKNMMNPINPQDAATKQYVDDAVSGGSSAYVTPEVLDERLTSYDEVIKHWAGEQHTLLDSTLRGWITANFLPSEPLNIHLRGDLHADGNAAIDGGLTVGGEINMQGSRIRNLQSPVADNDAATKAYVSQNYLKLVGGRMEGEINMAGLDGDKHRIVNLADYGSTAGDNGYNAVNKHYVDGATNAVVNYSASTFLPFSGGTMTGPVSMGGFKISNLSAPSSSSDASTKAYVDSRYSDANAFPHLDAFAFSSSTNFSSFSRFFSVPSSDSAVFYALLLHDVSNLSYYLNPDSGSSSEPSPSEYIVSSSVIVGDGTHAGDIVRYSVRLAASFPDGKNASFVLYGSRVSDASLASCVLLKFVPPAPVPPPVPQYSYSIQMAYNGVTTEIDPEHPVSYWFDERSYDATENRYDFSFYVYNSSPTYTDPITFTFSSNSSSVAPATLSSSIPRNSQYIFSFSADPDSDFKITCSTSTGESSFVVGYFHTPSAPVPEPAAE